MLNIYLCLSSKWAPHDSWVLRRVLQAPEMYPLHMKIRQGPTSANFHTIPIHFIQNIYKSSTIKAFQWLFESWFFILWMLTEFSTGWGGKSDAYICFYLAGRQLWLISRLRSYSAREESLFLCNLQWHSTGFLRNFQQFHHLSYGLHISWLFSTR